YFGVHSRVGRCASLIWAEFILAAIRWPARRSLLESNWLKDPEITSFLLLLARGRDPGRCLASGHGRGRKRSSQSSASFCSAGAVCQSWRAAAATVIASRASLAR